MCYSIVRHISTKLKQQATMFTFIDTVYDLSHMLPKWTVATLVNTAWKAMSFGPHKRIGPEIRAASSIETYVRMKTFRQINISSVCRISRFAIVET